MPYLRLLGAQVAIGAAAIFARFALSGAGPFAVSALRLGIAAALVALAALPFRRISIRREIALGCAGVALAAHFAAWIASLSYTSVAISTLLVTTTPVWTQLYETLRERRPPERTFVVALGFALAGVALIARGSGGGARSVPGHVLLGDVLALIGSIAIGAYFLIVRSAGARHAIPLATRQIVARTYGWSTLTLCVATLVTGERAPAASDVSAWAGIVAMALVSQLLGHTALNAALRDFSPSTVALTTLLEPVIAAALAALFFHEAVSLETFAGGMLVLGAVGLSLRTTMREAA